MEGPREPIRRGMGAVIQDDVYCNSCDYNLIGLREGGVCPECGTPIRGGPNYWYKTPDYGPTVIYRDPGPFFEAPLAYRERLGFLLIGLGLTGPAMGAAMVAAWLTEGVSSLAAASGAAVLGLAWAALAMAASRPRVVAKADKVDTAAELRWTRAWARWTQWCWAGGAGLLAVQTLAGQFGHSWGTPGQWGWAYGLGGWILVAIAATGAAALKVQLSNLVYWAGDAGLGYQLRMAAVGIGLGLVVGSLTLPLGHARAMVRGEFGAIELGRLPQIGAALAGLSALAAGVFAAVCFARLFMLGRWIRQHNATLEEQKARRREKAPPERKPDPVLEDEPIPLVGSESDGREPEGGFRSRPDNRSGPAR